MPPRGAIDRLLAEFVNREGELARFRELLTCADSTVFVIWGPGGVGKSSLQAKLIHEVATRGIAKSEVIWSETRNHDFIAIARKIRDDLGPEHFGKFTDLVNFYTVPQYELKISVSGAGNISVGQGAQLMSGAEVGTMAGIVIKDVMLTEPRADMQVSASERRTRLTDAFIEGMATALAERQAVVFFDAVEKMTEETRLWVWNEFLPAACDKRMGQVKIVLCGRTEPEIDRMWRDAFEVAELKPLTREHLMAYLERRGVDEISREPLADMLMVVTKGNMLDLATHVDGYLNIQRRRSA
jgi:GTPase SAR1 family protein